ncbi:MAG TPA: sigma-70 family RNA polymerase sigma factor [Candidatus Faecimonas gallistercoris]|nr:sigma-70 family RNA polymerase sigma factor [Candidatus Faecimonas gallistercoris]
MDYKEFNDYELLYLISEDTDNSYDILFQKYLPIIKSIAKKYCSFVQNHGAEFQDLIQEGYLGLNNAIVGFKDNYNNIFYTYACLCIERQIFTYCRSLSAQKHHILNASLPDELYSCTLIEDTSDQSNFFRIHSLELQNEFFHASYSLDFETRCVFELRFNGFSYREISKLLDISLSRVDSKISKARKYMRKVLEIYQSN